MYKKQIKAQTKYALTGTPIENSLAELWSIFDFKMQENKNENYEIGEEATRYGEFITSYFAWLPLSVQKEKVEDLENITNNKNKRKKAK